MRAIKIIVFVLGLLLAFGNGALSYVLRFTPGEQGIPWLAAQFIGYKSQLATMVFVLSITSVGLDGLRNYLNGRHNAKSVVEKLLNSYAKSLFPDRAMSNRLTLFKYSRGWRIFLWAVVRLNIFPVREQWPKIREVLRIKWAAYYLGVYLRPLQSWNRVSTAAFRVSNEDPSLCRGIVGKIWRENGLVAVKDLTPITKEMVLSKRYQRLSDLEETDEVRRYAEATGVPDMRTLLARTHFAKHFIGTVIETSAGQRWGVLLLDSGDDECPAIGAASAEFQRRFRDCAIILGKVVE